MTTFITICAYPLLVFFLLRTVLLLRNMVRARSIWIEQACASAAIKAIGISVVLAIWIVCYHCGIL